MTDYTDNCWEQIVLSPVLRVGRLSLSKEYDETNSRGLRRIVFSDGFTSIRATVSVDGSATIFMYMNEGFRFACAGDDVEQAFNRLAEYLDAAYRARKACDAGL